MTPGELVRSVRRRRGLTQTDLARRAGISQPVVSAYERGRRDPTFGTLEKLVAATGERLRIEAVTGSSDLPPALTPEEHGRRLLDVLSVADAIPARRRAKHLEVPRLVST